MPRGAFENAHAKSKRQRNLAKAKEKEGRTDQAPNRRQRIFQRVQKAKAFFKEPKNERRNTKQSSNKRAGRGPTKQTNQKKSML
jgi:hypothetical protein